MKIFPTTTTCQNPQFCCTAQQCPCLVFVRFFPLFPPHFPKLCQRDKGYIFYQDFICKLIHNISHKNWQQFVQMYRSDFTTAPNFWTGLSGKSQCSTGTCPGGKVPHSQQCPHGPEQTSAIERAPSLPIFCSASRAAAFPFHVSNQPLVHSILLQSADGTVGK